MRQLIALLLGGVIGCASIGATPGGPLRTTPPTLVKVTPDSGATDVKDKSVIFEFDVVVSDRGPGGELGNLFLLSPAEGAAHVDWKRNRIEVRPRKPFRPNTAYAVTMLPGISDQRGNVLKTSRTIVFSTGPTIPPYAVYGRVFDWMSERVAGRAIVEAIRHPDSLPYVGVSDSTGQFAVGPLDEGSYTVRGFIDNNNNRALDPGEPWDSVSIAVHGTSPFLELLLAPRDTTPPRLLTVNASDSVTFVASFDHPLDPSLPLSPPPIRVLNADSTALRIASVTTRATFDSIQRARLDSIALHEVTARAGGDTTRRPITRADTTRLVPQPSAAMKPSRPAPPKDLVVRLDPATPMRPNASYRIIAVNVRGLLGPPRTSDRVITAPRARADSAAAKARKP